jgi:hypothetical protein
MTCIRLLRMSFVTVLLLCLLDASGLTGPSAYYRDPDGYGYYEIWWHEGRADRETTLLLHIGPPQAPAWARPGNARIAEEEGQETEPLVDGGLEGALEMGGDLMGGMTEQASEQLAKKTIRNRNEKAPQGKLYDYSPNEFVYGLPEGVEKAPDGRFGEGLSFNGTGGIGLGLGPVGGRRTMDGWFRPTKLPDEPVWLMGCPGGARLHLLPDGRLKLSWIKRSSRLDSSRPRIHTTSETPVHAGEWAHIACYQTAKGKHEHDIEEQEVRIAINGHVVASYRGDFLRGTFRPMIPADDPFYLGADPEGKEAYTGLMDEIRVASRRRYHDREIFPRFDPATAPRPVPFGPPAFDSDTRIVHADFESRAITVHPEGRPELTWELGKHADFAFYQVEAPFGKGILIDPAMGFVRIPVQGMSPIRGSFELWVQPVNWDNHSGMGERIRWGRNIFSVARFRGRDKRTGKMLTFMELELPHAAMGAGNAWLQPSRWLHLLFSWAPGIHPLKHPPFRKGLETTPVQGPTPKYHGVSFGACRATWRSILHRNVEVLEHVEPEYVEFGISNDRTVYQGQRPAVLIDEVIVHSEALTHGERVDATGHWYEETWKPALEAMQD